MPPKRKGDEYDSGSDYAPEEASPTPSLGEVDSEEEDVKNKKAAPAKKKPAAKKKKAASDDDDYEEAGGSSGKKGAKPKAKKLPKITQITVGEDGWTLDPSYLIYKLNPEAQGGSKIAAFDLDGTLVGVKSGNQFPRSADDWKFFNKHVPAKLAELHEDGFQLWIITNQGGIKTALNGKMSDKVRERIDQVIAAVQKKAKEEVPFQVIASTHKEGGNHKPSRGMWDWLVQNANQGVQPNLSECFYVGDAAGRPTDIDGGADSDKAFAQAVGIEFTLPEDIFGESDLKVAADVSGESSGLNSGMAACFRKLAEVLKGEPFKARAFEKVAEIIDKHPTKITSAKDLKGVKGVGKSSEAKITEYLETGTLAALADFGVDMRAGVPVDHQAEVGLKFI